MTMLSRHVTSMEVNNLFSKMLCDKKQIEECDSLPEKVKSSLKSINKIESNNSDIMIVVIEESD